MEWYHVRLLLTLAEMLKCMNDEVQHVNTTCTKYGRTAAICIFTASCKLGLRSKTIFYYDTISLSLVQTPYDNMLSKMTELQCRQLITRLPGNH